MELAPARQLEAEAKAAEEALAAEQRKAEEEAAAQEAAQAEQRRLRLAAVAAATAAHEAQREAAAEKTKMQTAAAADAKAKAPQGSAPLPPPPVYKKPAPPEAAAMHAGWAFQPTNPAHQVALTVRRRHSSAAVQQRGGTQQGGAGGGTAGRRRAAAAPCLHRLHSAQQGGAGQWRRRPYIGCTRPLTWHCRGGSARCCCRLATRCMCWTRRARPGGKCARPPTGLRVRELLRPRLQHCF